MENNAATQPAILAHGVTSLAAGAMTCNLLNSTLVESNTAVILDLDCAVAVVSGNGSQDGGLWRGTSSVATTAEVAATFLGNFGDYSDIPSLVAALSGHINALEFGVWRLVGLLTYANNAAALVGGLTPGCLYRTSTGQVMMTF